MKILVGPGFKSGFVPIIHFPVPRSPFLILKLSARCRYIANIIHEYEFHRSRLLSPRAVSVKETYVCFAYVK